MPLTCLRRQREPGDAEGAGSFGPPRTARPGRAQLPRSRAAPADSIGVPPTRRARAAYQCIPRGVLTCLPRSPSPSPEASDRCRSRRPPPTCSPSDRAVVVARVNGELRDLAHVLADGDVVEPVTIDERGRPGRAAPLRRARARPGGAGGQPQGPARHRAARSATASTTTSTSRSPFTPDDLKELEKVMQRIVNEGQTFVRREISDDDARAELADEPYKFELIGLKGGAAESAAEGASRRGRRGAADHLRQRRAATAAAPGATCAAGPHVPTTKLLGNAFKLMRSGRGLLARLGEEPAAAARLRHRLADQGRAQGLPRPAGRGREARPPQARRRARPVQLPRRDRLRAGGVPPQGRGHQARDGGLRPPAAHRGGLPVRRHPAHQQGRAVPHLGAPAVLRRHDVPADGVRGQRVPPQGDELPDAQPHLPLARAVLPRAAAAAVRVRLGLPLREVRRRARPDPGARA